MHSDSAGLLLFMFMCVLIILQPEGMEQSFTKTLFLEFPLNKRNLSREMEFSFPVNVVPGSQRAVVTVVGTSTIIDSVPLVFSFAVFVNAFQYD